MQFFGKNYSRLDSWIWKQILHFFSNHIKPSTLWLWCINRTTEFTLGNDFFLVPLMQHDQSDLRLICLGNKTKSIFRNKNLIFSKKHTLSVALQNYDFLHIVRFSNRTGTSDDDCRARGITWILVWFDHIWVFVLHTPSSSDVPVLLLNQPLLDYKKSPLTLSPSSIFEKNPNTIVR